jgi:electron transfer flavoprotein alpha subunit
MKNILVYLESKDGELKRVSYEAISAAKNLATATGAKVMGIFVGGTEAQASKAGEYGLEELFIAKHNLLNKYSSTAYASAVAQAAKANSADVVLFGANSTGLELAPRVAAKLEAGYIGDCVALEANGGDITARKPVFAGKAQIVAKVNTAVKVFSLRPNVFTAVKTGTVNTLVKDFAPELSEKDFKAVVVSVAKNEGKLDVAEADVIVSGGRGLKGPENYNLIENLAKVLGGAVGASRAVVAAWFIPALLIVFVAACFSELTSEVACVLTAVTAIFLSAIGFIPISTGALVTALAEKF